MALIKCTECGAQISDRARKCPSCGCPIEEILKEMSTQDEQKIIKEADDPKQSRKKRKNGIIIVGAAVLVVILVVVFFNFFNMRKINRHSPYLSITLHKCYPYYLFGISTFPNSAYHSIALRKFSITIV